MKSDHLNPLAMVSEYLKRIQNKRTENPETRHQDHLESLSSWIAAEYKKTGTTSLNFICTHNSRRSQFSQVWCHMVQSWMGLKVADAFSGGTEVTACNERTVAALERAGLGSDKQGSENPRYLITAPEFDTEITLWSKTYDDDLNPKSGFAAIMTCDHADENCPFVPGAVLRVPLTYTDPKYADDSPEESSAYDTACETIATDMIRLFILVKEKINQA